MAIAVESSLFVIVAVIDWGHKRQWRGGAATMSVIIQRGTALQNGSRDEETGRREMERRK